MIRFGYPMLAGQLLLSNGLPFPDNIHFCKDGRKNNAPGRLLHQMPFYACKMSDPLPVLGLFVLVYGCFVVPNRPAAGIKKGHRHAPSEMRK